MQTKDKLTRSERKQKRIMRASAMEKVIEMCSCGHPRGAHKCSLPTVHGLGHGACVTINCKCPKFTWVPKV